MRGGQRGRKEEEERERRAVAELNRYVIKRSEGHIKERPDEEDVTPLLDKIKLKFVCFSTTMCLCVHVCVCSSSLETGGSWLAGCSSSAAARLVKGW